MSALGIGTEAQQLARLDHAHERHGLEVDICPECLGLQPERCETCDETGLIFVCAGDLTPCGPECPLHDARPV